MMAYAGSKTLVEGVLYTTVDVRDTMRLSAVSNSSVLNNLNSDKVVAEGEIKLEAYIVRE